MAAPSLPPEQCAGTGSNQSANGSATATAGYSANEGTGGAAPQRAATRVLRSGRQRQYQGENCRCESDHQPVRHFQPLVQATFDFPESLTSN
jgi:hypothetical protein